jgi:hypothetical protein
MPDEGDGFLRATEISSTPSFGGEAKPPDPCRKILRHVTKPSKERKKERDTSYGKIHHILRYFLLRCSHLTLLVGLP